MKTSLAYSILYENAARGSKGLYVSLEQSRASLADHVESLGFSAGKAGEALSILDLSALRKKLADEGSWTELFRMYTQSVRVGFPYEALVLDSLDAFEILARFRNYRREVFELFKWLRGLGCTTLVLGELPSSAKGHAPQAFGKHREDYLADGIVHLSLQQRGDFEVQRRIRVVKMRGARHDTGYHALVFDRGFRVTDVIS
jgi:KaiC/GvpD/RAD55 family RecA-like ATPase